MLPYTVKESPRAKRVRLQVSPTEGVIVVAPQGFSHSRIAAFVHQRRDWIEKHLHRFATRKQEKHPRAHEFPPKSLELRAVRQTWHFSYEAAAGNASRIIVPGELLIKGDLSALRLKSFFHAWLGTQAKFHLPPKLDELSRLAGLPYAKSVIKCQKGRWGSCSSRGNINLNYKLLFLPSPMARYVLIHELAHTRHLNHSAAFWNLVEMLEPDYRELDKELDDGWCYVPEWA